MPNPWDRPPFPKQGNRSTFVLYASIGRALIFWEALETTLARLYAALCEQSLYDDHANQAYGEPLNFRKRLANLKAVGCRYFQKRPHQDLEADLAWVIKHADGYSQRRNDVAHGLVREIDLVLDPRASLRGDAPLRWCLVPPNFRETKFIAPNVPAYVLTSREINRLWRSIEIIIRRAWILANAVELPQHALRRKHAAPPT